jgi:hypothetical protein
VTTFSDRLWACLLNLEAHHARTYGWQPSSSATPTLHFLRRTAGEIVTRQIPIPDHAWRLATSLGGYINAATEAFDKHRTAIGPLTPPDLAGVAVVFEGWGLSADEDKEFERYAKSRRIHQHPDRRECRMALGAPLVGPSVYTVIRYRRKNEILKFPDPEHHAAEIDGDVPAALRDFAQAMLSVAQAGL